MAQKTINLGNTDQGNGDPLRTAFGKVNDNFTELYTALGLGDTSLNLGSFEFTNNVMTTTDSSAVIIDQNVTITNELTMQGDIVPNRAGEHNLGSSTKPWNSLYVSGSTIYIGGQSISINDSGELVYNGNRVAHESGEFMTLDNLSDLNVNSPNAGDTIAWSGSQYVNVPLTQDRLADDGDELILVGGANPYVTFPAITGGDQLVIQGGEVTASSGNLALTGQSTVTIISNAAGGGGVGAQYFQFAANGTLMFPDGSLALTDSVLSNGLDADIKGSVFGDDSSVIVDAINRTLHSVSVNTLQLNFNISGDNIVAPTGGYITIGNSDGAGGVNNVATFDGGGIIFAQDITMGVGKKIQSASGDELQLVSATNMGDFTWTFNASGALLFPSIPAGDHYEQIVIGGAEILAQDSLILLESFNDLVRIVANSQGPAKNWTFDTAGDLTLPGDLQSNGNIDIKINLADSTQRIWQFGEDGDFTIPGNLIYGGDTIHAKESTATAGNPLTVRAGDSETQVGGNLILRGGDTIGSVGTPRNSGWAVLRAGSTVTGNGGYAELLGGNTTAGDGGQAYVTAGSTTTGNGGPVEITAGDTVTGDGGSVTIESGEAVTGTAGNINITAKGTVTGDGGNVNLTGGSVTSGNGGAINLTAGDTIGSGDPGTIRLRTFNAAATQDWTFNFNGTLTFPDTTVQSTAWTKSAAAVQSSAPSSPVTGQLWYDTDDGNTYIWTGSAWVDSNPAAAAPTVDITNTNGIDTNYSITFVETRDTAQILRADVDLTFNSWSNTLTAGNVTTGVLKIEDGAHEKFQAKADATGVVAHDCASGHVFYHTSPDANWTVNLTNLNLSSGYATAVTLVIVQGGTGYYPSAVQIGGVGQTLNWQGNTTPTPSTNRTDVVTFSIINNSGTYTVLGQLTGF